MSAFGQSLATWMGTSAFLTFEVGIFAARRAQLKSASKKWDTPASTAMSSTCSPVLISS